MSEKEPSIGGAGAATQPVVLERRVETRPIVCICMRRGVQHVGTIAVPEIPAVNDILLMDKKRWMVIERIFHLTKTGTVSTIELDVMERN